MRPGRPMCKLLSDVLTQRRARRKRVLKLLRQLHHQPLADKIAAPSRHPVAARFEHTVHRHLVQPFLAGNRHEAHVNDVSLAVWAFDGLDLLLSSKAEYEAARQLL